MPPTGECSLLGGVGIPAALWQIYHSLILGGWGASEWGGRGNDVWEFVGDVVVAGDVAEAGGGTESRSEDVELFWSELSLLSLALEGGGLLQWTFMCFLSELGCV